MTMVDEQWPSPVTDDWAQWPDSGQAQASWQALNPDSCEPIIDPVMAIDPVTRTRRPSYWRQLKKASDRRTNPDERTKGQCGRRMTEIELLKWMSQARWRKWQWPSQWRTIDRRTVMTQTQWWKKSWTVNPMTQWTNDPVTQLIE